MMKKISFVVPIYNEMENIYLIANAIREEMVLLKYNYSILFVNDGSIDNSLTILKKISLERINVKFLSFSRNFGKEAALTAGINFAKADAIIMIDADLQHPPEMIKYMLSAWEDDYEIVYCKRDGKNIHTTFINTIFSKFFYSVMSLLSNVHLEDGASDFRLLDKKVVEILNKWKEQEPFYRGLTKWVGFKQKSIFYTPRERVHGETKYNTKKLIRLALQGITSFSTKPLYIATYLGFAFSLASLLFVPYAIFSYYYGQAVSGWTSVIVAIAFFGGLQLMILGIIGLYLGKLFMQSKGRPLYIIKESNIHA